MSRGYAIGIGLVAFACGLSLALAAWGPRTEPPRCTAGASSINAEGEVTQTWKPKGCVIYPEGK